MGLSDVAGVAIGVPETGAGIGVAGLLAMAGLVGLSGRYRSARR